MNSRTIKIINNVNKFYASSLSFVCFLSITLVFAIIQIILYVTNIISLNGTYFSDPTGQVAAWLALGISLTGCFVGFIGAILNLRGSLNFVYWATSQLVLSILISFFAGIILTSVALFFSMIATIFRYFAWKLKWLDKWIFKKKTLHILVTIFVIIISIVFIILVVFIDSMHQYVNGDPKPLWTGIFDALSASLIIGASILLIFKSRWAFVLYFITKIFAISNYAYTGNIISSVQLILFISMDITGFISWTGNLVPDTVTYEE
ncbi:MAG: nicotinamide mononucleotide transporter [Mycoplasmataceae bacterium]|nr:nicotinamide mononucleotide transporter [Mycoplasmataceae bacterium]